MKTILAMVAVALCNLAPAFAQTPSEDLQRAIFLQDAQGNLDGAIQLYRQLANSTFAPRDVSAHAQYRLSQALLQKRDLPGATRELERLEKTFPEYQMLIINLKDAVRKASATGPATTVAPGNFQSPAVATMVAELAKVTVDAGPLILLRGKITAYLITNETAFIMVESEGKRYAVVLAPTTMNTTASERRSMFRPGESVTVDARHPYTEPKVAEGVLGLRAQTITRADGTVAFRR